MKTYEDVSHDVLKALPNPGGAIELKHKAPEVTFLGVHDQPDFATLYITMYPQKSVIELKSLKDYLYQWRNVVVSYERFLDVVYEHFMTVYKPVRLRLTLETRPRGGISSKLTIDSDWAIRGGKEGFHDWVAWRTPGDRRKHRHRREHRGRQVRSTPAAAPKWISSMYFNASSFSEWSTIRRTGSDEIDSSAPKSGRQLLAGRASSANGRNLGRHQDACGLPGAPWSVPPSCRTRIDWREGSRDRRRIRQPVGQ